MLTGTLARLLNRGLPRSPRAQQLCAQLAGRSVAIVVREVVRLRVAADGVALAVTRDELAADATIAGGPLGLAALAGADAQAVLQRGDVTISGDAETAQKFRELATLLTPDVEEELSLLLGDVAAHRVGTLARSGERWARRAGQTTLRNVAEYLAHERRDLVARNEGEQFLRGVDALREGVDRLQARLELLARRRGQP